MFDPHLILLGTLLQLLVVIFLIGADRIAEVGSIFITARLIPDAGDDSPKQASRRSVIAAIVARCCTAVIALVPILVPFLLLFLVAERYTTPSASWAWFWTACGVGGIFVLMLWLFIAMSKSRAAKLAGRELKFPVIDSLGMPVRSLPRNLRVAAAAKVSRTDLVITLAFFGTATSFLIYMAGPMVAPFIGAIPPETELPSLVLGAGATAIGVVVVDRLRWSVGKALKEIEFLFGSRLDYEAHNRRFTEVLRYRKSLPKHLRMVAYLQMLNSWAGHREGSEPAAQSLIAAAKVLDKYRTEGSVLETEYPAEAKQVALDSAAVLIAPSNQAALKTLFKSAEVLTPDNQIRPDLITATTFNFQQRVKALSEMIGSAQVVISGIAAFVATVIALMTVLW